MPELPEVETIVRGLHKKVLGRKITEVRVLGPIIRRNADDFPARLRGQTIDSIVRHGKFMFLTLRPSQHLLKIHLGMTGQLLFESPETTPLKHTHVIFQLEGLSEELRYRDIRRFGYLEVIEKKDTKLGPDAWNSTDEEIYDALRQKLGMLKNALLNQNVLAGLGNIYVDESLFRTKLHPRKTLESLSAAKLKELCDSIRVVLGDSLNVGGTSFRNYVDTKGSRGGFKGRLKVYGKDGTPCSNCSTKIKKILVAGRGTHYCPKCQRAPRRSP